MIDLGRKFTNLCRVVVDLHYYMPLPEGSKPLKVASNLIGEEPRTVNHRGILQTFLFQDDDVSDLAPEQFGAFYDQIARSNGIVRIADPRERLALFAEEAQALTGKTSGTRVEATLDRIAAAPSIIIPKAAAGSESSVELNNFHTLVPFPKVREFLKFWERELDGPLHHIQYEATTLVNYRGYRGVDIHATLQ